MGPQRPILEVAPGANARPNKLEEELGTGGSWRRPDGEQAQLGEKIVLGRADHTDAAHDREEESDSQQLCLEGSDSYRSHMAREVCPTGHTSRSVGAYGP